ncbi:helix-turn-helix domain-containing protein [Actinopolymorpha sp. B17G11]|uniref:helix-turn-helix domain-containing protein n=1 Tax=Actinopolymorpha sp. B17G11 TaxID=3160861 RepID=UPI0032E519AE
MTAVLRGKGEAAAAEPRRFFSVAEVARMLGMSEMTLYRAIHAGEFPAIRIRGRLIVPAKALDEIVDQALNQRAVVDAADWAPASGVAG